MGCTLFWVNSAMHLLILWFRVTSQMALLSNINFYFDCKTRLCLIIPGRQEKIYFCQETFYLQGILDDINEHDTSFLDCEHKHMMKSALVHALVPGLISIFRDGMGPFKSLSL